MRDWVYGSDEWQSIAFKSDGKLYGVPAGLMFSFPCTTKDGKYYDAVPNAEAPATTAQAAPQATQSRQAVDITDPEQFHALQARAMAYADLYRMIHQRLAAGDAQDPLDMYTLPESDLHAAAASVFIAITRGA